MNLSHLPVLLVAVVLVITGGANLVLQDETAEGYALMAAGFVVLGAWLALEIRKGNGS